MQVHNREAIRYLEFCVESLKVDEVAIHNFLVSLYINQREIEKLMIYLEKQGKVSGWYTQYRVMHMFIFQCLWFRLRAMMLSMP